MRAWEERHQVGKKERGMRRAHEDTEKLKMEGGGRDVKNNHSEGMAVFIPPDRQPADETMCLVSYFEHA